MVPNGDSITFVAFLNTKRGDENQHRDIDTTTETSDDLVPILGWRHGLGGGQSGKQGESNDLKYSCEKNHVYQGHLGRFCH